MRWTRMVLGRLMVGAACLTLAGCGDDSCAELLEICGTCPESGNGIVARDSCERTAESGDEEACEDRVDQGTYAAFGCGE